MKLQLFLIVVFAAFISCAPRAEVSDDEGVQDRILNGDLAEAAKYPFIVNVQERKPGEKDPFRFCGASILSEKWLLTAAHCYDHVKSTADIRINAGVVDANNFGSKSQEISVKKWFIHPKYSRIAVHDDIALIELLKPLKFNKHVSPISLPPADYEPTGEGKILGWGAIDPKEEIRSQYLREATIHVSTEAECNKHDSPMSAATQICLGVSDKTTACQGDSGGPFMQMINNKPCIVGVTSFAGKGCTEKAPSVYTKVSAYKSWIEETMKNNP
ncbi:chymotrypsinogen B-like [Chrysoperla carnea]|uniref:chymotrypsinogen B-like n=1 Tax=Chrysoperla carnea TaxID=189513 RepID=UPI001D095308|nr:chymotrypsinogen B-like [Chrysoperla carnea]